MALVILTAAWLGGTVLGVLMPTAALVAPWWVAGLAGVAAIFWQRPGWRWSLLAGALLALKFMPARHLAEAPAEMTHRPEPAGGARVTPSRCVATEPLADREEAVL